CALPHTGAARRRATPVEQHAAAAAGRSDLGGLNFALSAKGAHSMPSVPPSPRATKPPKNRAPAKSCDCHFYIFGPPATYPLASTLGYSPPLALLPQYRAMIDTLGIERMVIVHPSVYGTDNRCSLDAMAELGERCRMVAVVDAFVTDAQLKQMDAAGVRGARFHLISMGGQSRNVLEAIARRIAPLGW